MRRARRVRAQARLRGQQRQVQQLPAPAGRPSRGPEQLAERHRQEQETAVVDGQQGAAAAAADGGPGSDAERQAQRQRRHGPRHARLVHDLAARQRREHRAEGRLSHQWLAAVLDTAQEDLSLADEGHGE